MNKSLTYLAAIGLSIYGASSSSAQIKMNSKGIGALGKGLKAVTFSDADAASCKSGVVNTLSETQIAAFASALIENKYSRKQEREADDFAYNKL